MLRRCWHWCLKYLRQSPSDPCPDVPAEQAERARYDEGMTRE